MWLISQAQDYLLLIVTLVVFVAQLAALVDAAIRPPTAYTRAGKRSKTFWVGILAAAAAFGFLAVGQYSFLFLGMVALVPGIIYLSDVRPAIRPYRGGPGRGGGRSSW